MRRLSRGHGAVHGSCAAALLLAALVALACRSTIVATGARPSLERDALGRQPAAAYFREPMLSHLTLSPDGSHIAAIVSRADHEVVIVKPTRGGELRFLANLDRGGWRAVHTIRGLGWPANDLVMVILESPFSTGRHMWRARQTRLMVVPLDGGKPRYLAEEWPYQAYSSRQDAIISWLPDDPDHILLAWWKPGEQAAAARRVNVRNGVMRTVARGVPNTFGFAADHRGVVRASWGASEHGTTVFTHARAGADGDFVEIDRSDPFVDRSLSFAGFGESPGTIHVLADDENGRTALYAYDLDARSLGAKLSSHPEYDIGDVWHSDRDGRLIAAGYQGERPEVHFLDDKMRSDQRGIDTALPSTRNTIVDIDAREHLALVVSASDVSPPVYHLFDRVSGRLTYLIAQYPELEGERFAPMRAVTIEARDGLPIHGYLTLPHGTEPGGLPAIVLPHGGPTARDVWGWNAEVQFLASRGFAVLQPNFRGSSGYGLEHMKKGFRQWGLAMQDDLTDATRWLIDQGIADPTRIGIYGGSYGGYAALMGLVKEPGLYAAGASFAGVTDLIEFLDDRERLLFSDFNVPVIGDRNEDRDVLAATSPALRADRIRAPVLIAHGLEDPIVPVDQAHRMIDALEAAGVPVESHLYEHEVHGFVDERTRIDFYEKLAAFFERHLGGAPAAVPVPATAGSGAP